MATEIKGFASDWSVPAGAKANLDVLYAGRDSQVYNVLKWGAFGNGTNNNDTTGIQAAINAAHTAGGGVVFLPARDYSVSQLRLKSRVTIQGAGWGTRIIQRAGTTGHIVVLDTVSTEFTVLRDLQIHGNKENQTAANDCVNYDNTAGTFSFYDPNHIIENVLCYIPKGNGFTISANSRETKLSNCFVTGADGSGYVLNATDSVAINCTTGAAGGTGFVLGGANSRITGCKAFGSGRLNIPGNRNGFRLTGRRMSVTACEAQDNGEHGFQVYNLSGAFLTITGCIADSNGRQAAGSGFYIQDSSNIVMSGCMAFDRETAKTQRHGLTIGGSVSFADITIMSSGNATGDMSGALTHPFVLKLNGKASQTLTSPNGTNYTLGVTDAGALTTTA